MTSSKVITNAQTNDFRPSASSQTGNIGGPSQNTALNSDSSGPIPPAGASFQGGLNDLPDDSPQKIDPNSRNPEKTAIGVKWYKQLREVITEAKDTEVKCSLFNTKLIFVVGSTGVGKTSILSELTGLDLKVGATLQSGTRKFEICPALIDGDKYIFIDTAGFGAADMNDLANLDDIRSCLMSLGCFVTVVGVMYILGPPRDRYEAEQAKTMRWIQCFCGPQFFRNVIMITTKWDKPKLKALKQDLANFTLFRAQQDTLRLLDPELYHGGKVYSHGFPGELETVEAADDITDPDDHEVRREELRDLIRSQYGALSRPPAKLQFLAEIESSTPWDKTQAAKALSAVIDQTEIQLREAQAIVVPKPGVSTDMPRRSEMGPSPPLENSKKQANAAGSSEKKSSKGPKNEPSFSEKILKWAEVALAAAGWFRESKKSKANPPPWSIYGAFNNWWYGSKS